MPVADHTNDPGAVQSERDAWVHAIDKLCSEWKRKSRSEYMFVETKALRNISIAEETEDTDTDLESSGEFGGGNRSHSHSPVHLKNADLTSGGEDQVSPGETGQSHPSADNTKPVAKPRRTSKAPGQIAGPDLSPQVQSQTSPQPSPTPAALPSSSTVPESLTHESGPPVEKIPSPPSIPAPPPLPLKAGTKSRKPCTKAFHWDLVGSEKVS